VQTAVTMIVVLGQSIIKHMGETDRRLEQWFFSYIGQCNTSLLSTLALLSPNTNVRHILLVSVFSSFFWKGTRRNT